MPLTLSVGFSKKIGLPAYSSVGASCNVQLEVDPRLLDRGFAEFHKQVEQAFEACRRSVDAELGRLLPNPPGGAALPSEVRDHSEVSTEPCASAPASPATCHAANNSMTADGGNGTGGNGTGRIDGRNLGESHGGSGILESAMASTGSTLITNGQRATGKQVDYLRQLVGQIPGLGIRRLEAVARRAMGKPLAELSCQEASQLIDLLRAVKRGKFSLAELMQGGSP